MLSLICGVSFPELAEEADSLDDGGGLPGQLFESSPAAALIREGPMTTKKQRANLKRGGIRGDSATAVRARAGKATRGPAGRGGGPGKTWTPP